MSDLDIQLKYQNKQGGFDNLYPKSKADLIQMEDGSTFEEHVKVMNARHEKLLEDFTKTDVKSAPEIMEARQSYRTLLENLQAKDVRIAGKADVSQIGQPTQAQVDAWLSRNPQATTTVQDGSITPNKMADLPLRKLGLVRIPPFVQGNFATTTTGYVDGNYTTGIKGNSTRIVASQLMDVKAGDRLVLDNHDYMYTVHYFDSASKLVAQGVVWEETDLTFTKDSKIALQLRRTDNTALTPSAFSYDNIRVERYSVEVLSDRIATMERTLTNDPTLRTADLAENISNKYAVSDGNLISTKTISANYGWVTFDAPMESYETVPLTNGSYNPWLVLAHNATKGTVLAFMLYAPNSSGQEVRLREFTTDAGDDLLKRVTGTVAIGDVGTQVVFNQNSDDLVSYTVNGSTYTFQLSNYYDMTGYEQVSGFLEGGQWTVQNVANNVKLKRNDNLSGEVSELSKRMDFLESGSGVAYKTVDLVMFMGQSNMAGRGTASQAPKVGTDEGYEFRAISDPTKLYPIVEPFGVNENNATSGVTETSKTGSMVSAFANAYYKLAKVPVVGVSCSKGGTTISQWQPETPFLNDAITRYKTAKNWLTSNGYTIRRSYMVWCQGESDGDKATTPETYKSGLVAMVNAMVAEGIEKCFVVRIGNHRDNATLYDPIIQAQTELAKTNDKIVLVATKFDKMATDGLMKDTFHYTQTGYNMVGEQAGVNTAFYINNQKEPTMYDWENQNLYYSYK